MSVTTTITVRVAERQRARGVYATGHGVKRGGVLHANRGISRLACKMIASKFGIAEGWGVRRRRRGVVLHIWQFLIGAARRRISGWASEFCMGLGACRIGKRHPVDDSGASAAIACTETTDARASDVRAAVDGARQRRPLSRSLAARSSADFRPPPDGGEG